MDREKAIKGLEICTKDIPMSNAVHKSDFCKECPYYNAEYSYCWNQIVMMRDALALLKEQEAVEPIPPTDESEMWRCGNCHHQIFRCTHQRFCDNCGRAVKWE